MGGGKSFVPGITEICQQFSRQLLSLSVLLLCPKRPEILNRRCLKFTCLSFRFTIHGLVFSPGPGVPTGKESQLLLTGKKKLSS